MRKGFLILSILLCAWKSENPIALKSEALTRGLLGPKPTSKYITIDFDFEPFAAVRKEIEKRRGVQLKNRGEAHVTIITPPEFDRLTKSLTPAEVRAVLGRHLNPSNLEAKAVCVGEGRLGQDEAWYVVLELTAALKARAALEKLFIERGGRADDFKAALFYPHVTLGFTSRDLHLEDGVTKDVNSCKYPIGS